MGSKQTKQSRSSSSKLSPVRATIDSVRNGPQPKRTGSTICEYVAQHASERDTIILLNEKLEKIGRHKLDGNFSNIYQVSINTVLIERYKLELFNVDTKTIHAVDIVGLEPLILYVLDAEYAFAMNRYGTLFCINYRQEKVVWKSAEKHDSYDNRFHRICVIASTYLCSILEGSGSELGVYDRKGLVRIIKLETRCIKLVPLVENMLFISYNTPSFSVLNVETESIVHYQLVQATNRAVGVGKYLVVSQEHELLVYKFQGVSYVPYHTVTRSARDFHPRQVIGDNMIYCLDRLYLEGITFYSLDHLGTLAGEISFPTQGLVRGNQIDNNRHFFYKQEQDTEGYIFSKTDMTLLPTRNIYSCIRYLHPLPYSSSKLDFLVALSNNNMFDTEFIFL
jgi:hypothetical protein